ncbi:MAG: hypothetical protein M1827_004003 [Pycnora praestabilis]|nr:MAG: hypothetical protein M1827_004003 [Pycnora praestabilis]
MTHLLTGNKFDPNTDIPDLSGKVFAVTGGSAGIGFGIVAHLLQHNAAKILLLSNKEEHAEEAIEELKKYGDNQRVQWIKCDLANLKQVDEVAKKLLEEQKQLDCLICNAGLGVGKYWETQDGLDSHFQVNHLSQMHLFLTLLPNLQRTPTSRAVFMSSDLHRGFTDSATFTSVSEINTDIGPMKLYNRTKLAQVLFVRAVKRRMDDGELGFKKYDGKDNILYVNATHPGGVATDQQEQAKEAYGVMGKIGVGAVAPLLADPVDVGCRSGLFAATGENIVKEGISGQYIVPDCKVTDPSKTAQDVELGENLWKLSEQILAEKIGKQPYMTHV